MELDKKDIKIINRIIIISGIIILVASMEALMTAKSLEVYKAFKLINGDASQSDFINYILINFFMNILEPVFISIYTFASYRRYGISKMYKFVFSGLILIRFINILFKFNTGSIFYFEMLFLYLVFFFIIATTPLKKRKVKNGLF